MAGLPKIERVSGEILDQWFSVVVDTLNYDLGQIQDAVVALDQLITLVDTPPINYLKDSFADLVRDINKAFDVIETRLNALESKGVL